MLDFGATDFLSFGDFLKATPAEEGGHRYVYLQASNEATDFQNEVVLSKALAESADYFLKFGNLDLDHITVSGPKKGTPNYAAFEIGRPLEVKANGSETWVKGEIFQGDTPTAANANTFWESLTRQRPPQRWYPSVGGSVMARSDVIDPVTREKRTLIKAVRWVNIGFSKTPVNLDVPTVSATPFGALAKSWGPEGLDLRKALEAGYGTDSATLTGGGALRTQSLDPQIQNYWDFRERLAGDIRARKAGSRADDLIKHASEKYRLDPALAGEWTERFLGDLRGARKPKETTQ
jgi:hypothetical protein